MKVVVRDMVPEDIQKIDMRSYESGSILGDNEEQNMEMLYRLQHIACMGPAKTICVDKEIILIAGVAVMWKGVGEAWLLSSKNAMKHGMVVARTAKKHIALMAKELGVRRLQAHAPVSYTGALRWLKFLGMEQESIAEKYTVDGEDAVIFKRLFDGN